MIGITIPPPSLLFELRYDMYKMAVDKYYKKPGSPIKLQGAYDAIEYDLSFFHNAVVKFIPDSVRANTPRSSGQLQQSIEGFSPGGWRPGPTESLQWAFYEPVAGVWVDKTETTMPRYYYELFICYSNEFYLDYKSYAMPVETGTPILYNTHYTPPIQRLGYWARRTFGASDPSIAWKMQAVIRSRGTPARAMFWNGFIDITIGGLEQFTSLLSRDYWTVERQEYHLVPVEV